jgi:CHAD domain-containing protein
MYRQARPTQDLLTYAGHVVESLLRDLAFAIRRTLDQPNAANVHDLRRVCLRLRHAVRWFGGVLPGPAARKTRRRLGDLQDLLGGVRSCDVALEVLEHHSLAAAMTLREQTEVGAALAAARRHAVRPLRVRLRRLQRSEVLRRWRTQLLGAA